MSYDEGLRTITLNADASLAVYTGVPSIPGSPTLNYGKQYTFVKVTGARQCGLATAKTDLSVGVLQNKPQVTGQAATVGIRGVSNVMAGAAITAGATVTCDATGRAVASTGTDVVYGIALAAATGANELVPVLLRTN